MKTVRTFTDTTWSVGLTTPWDFVGNPYGDVGNENIWGIHPEVNDGYPFLAVLDTTAPHVPTLIAPGNGAIICNNTPTFVWNSVSDPSGVTYTFEIIGVLTKTGLTSTSYTLTGTEALPDGTYSWRVRAVDGAGNIGDWSDTWSFRIITVPTVITTVEELQAMNNDLVNWYILGNDIDASATKNWNSGAGFEPIGPGWNAFSGSFDGRGYKIYNLYINRPSTFNVGLFAFVGSGGVVENVGLENENVIGCSKVGGLVGWNWGTVSNSYSTGAVSGHDAVGGLIGYLYDVGNVSNSYSACSVSGGYRMVGGLVGYNYWGTVSNCYSTGSVSGGYEWVGGLVGYSCGTVSNSFYNENTSGRSDTGKGTPKTTDNMKYVRTLTDNTWSTGLTTPWDFVGNPYGDVGNENIWNINPAINDGYPFFTWAHPDTTPPSTTHSLSGTRGNAGWWLSDVTVTLTATDATSSVASTCYRVDGGAWQTYSKPFVVSGDGTCMVDYYSVDMAGNVESMKSVEVKIVAMMLVWGEGSVLKYRLWNGENWGPAENVATLGGRVNWTVLKYARTRNEAVLGALDATGSIRVWIWDGNNRTWSASKLLASVGTTIAKYRPFDIEYETSQDRAMVVFLPSSTATKPKYMIWNGTSWSDNTTIGNIPTGVAYWIELAPNPLDGSNEMAMITLNSAKGVSGMVWKGSAWDNMGTTAVLSSVPLATKKCIDVAYEQKSGRAMFIWADSVATQQYYRIWNGSTLTSKALLKIPEMGGVGQWARLVPDPNSNKLMYGVQDAKANLNTRQWSGSAWDNSSQHLEHDAAVEDILDRNFDIVYETFPGHEGHAWLVWGDGDNVARRHWNGGSWDNITKAGDDTACVQLATHPASGMVFALVYEDSTSAKKNFYDMRLTSGSGTWTSKYLIWGGPTPANPVMEPFMIACRRKGAYVHV
jgi:hypothetical protein